MHEHHKIWSTSLTIAWPCIGDSWPAAQPSIDNRRLHEAAAKQRVLPIHMSSRILLGRFKETRIHTSGHEHPQNRPCWNKQCGRTQIGANCGHLEPSGAIWSHLGHLGPSEAILDYQGLLGWGNLSHLGLPTQTSCQLTHPACPLQRNAHMQTALNAN